MLVSHRKKFIFTKTSKTAGTSVEVFFEKYCYPEEDWTFSHARDEYINYCTGIVGQRGSKPEGVTFYNHMPAHEIKKKLELDVWNDYFKFTVVRNPFDKIISTFFFQNRKTMPKEKFESNPIGFVKKFREWVKNKGVPLDRNAYMINNEIALDFFIRFENLEDDVARVCKKINVECDLMDLPKLKSEYRDRSLSLRDMYDNETVDIVRKIYDFELDYFGYDFCE